MADSFLAKAELAVAKIAATPTMHSWSQAYNAGNLFAVVTLTQKATKEPASLNEVGKAIITTLEQEYFTLETKNLANITQAVASASQKAVEGVFCSLAVGAIVHNVLYAFVKGDARVLLSRKETLGTILTTSVELESASGYVEDADMIVLETESFHSLIPDDKLVDVLALSPFEAAESLTPIVHGNKEGGSAAIIVQYREAQPQPPLQIATNEEQRINTAQTTLGDNLLLILSRIRTKALQLIMYTALYIKRILPKNIITGQNRVFLLGAAVLIMVLIVASIASLNQQEAKKRQEKFLEVSRLAQQKFDEGEALLGLNKNLARDSLFSAKEIINASRDEFAKNTKERKNIEELSSRIEEAINKTSNINAVKPVSVGTDKSALLAYKQANNALYVAKTNTTMYGLYADGVYTSSSSQKGQKNITNNGDWSSVGGLGIYLTNLYVLDTKAGQVFKFVPSASGYTKASYFTNTLADLKDGVSLAIDGNIWVLTKQGSIKKYLRGNTETFAIVGLDSPLKSPTRLFTGSDTDKLYVLDNGNSRLVVLNKNGSYLEQYNASVFKNAKEMDVVEKDKKVYLLSEGKVWEISIK
ncbi:MAG: hypothetical protein HY429_00790 [Candidatus Levybacteria bacterium]|nr:hypothetical protein [Candidatus Levybacteria bacterium]